MQGVDFNFCKRDFLKSLKVNQITGQGVLRVNNTLKSVLAKFQSDWMTLEKVIELFLSFSRFDRGEVSRA